MLSFHRKQLARHGANMFLVSGVHAIAPLASLLVQILPAREPASGQEIFLNKPEWPLHPSRTVGIAEFVSHELEAETLGKSRHLGHGNHLAPGATQHHHVSVVDHHASRHRSEIAQGVGEKHLAVETLKGGIHLEEQYARIAQDRRGRLHLAALAAQLELVRRGVVLNFFAWLEMVVSRRHDGLLSDAMPAAEGG